MLCESSFLNLCIESHPLYLLQSSKYNPSAEKNKYIGRIMGSQELIGCEEARFVYSLHLAHVSAIFSTIPGQNNACLDFICMVKLPECPEYYISNTRGWRVAGISNLSLDIIMPYITRRDFL